MLVVRHVWQKKTYRIILPTVLIKHKQTFRVQIFCGVNTRKILYSFGGNWCWKSNNSNPKFENISHVPWVKIPFPIELNSVNVPIYYVMLHCKLNKDYSTLLNVRLLLFLIDIFCIQKQNLHCRWKTAILLLSYDAFFQCMSHDYHLD